MYRFDQGNLQGVPDYGSDMERDNARFEIEMRRLQASNAYSMADQQNRAKMEAQLIAMKEGFLPAPMAQNLIGVPQFNGEPPNGAVQPGMTDYTSENDSNAGGVFGGIAGGIAGGTFGRAPLANGLASAGRAVTNVGSLGNLAKEGLLNTSSALQYANEGLQSKTKARPGSIFDKLIKGHTKATVKTMSALDKTAMKLGGKMSTKTAGSIFGKLAGGVASKGVVGAAIGGIPGFLIGTAIGTAIEKLMEGNEKDQAKAQFMLSQYR